MLTATTSPHCNKMNTQKLANQPSQNNINLPNTSEMEAVFDLEVTEEELEQSESQSTDTNLSQQELADMTNKTKAKQTEPQGTDQSQTVLQTVIDDNKDPPNNTRSRLLLTMLEVNQKYEKMLKEMEIMSADTRRNKHTVQKRLESENRPAKIRRPNSTKSAIQQAEDIINKLKSCLDQGRDPSEDSDNNEDCIAPAVQIGPKPEGCSRNKEPDPFEEQKANKHHIYQQTIKHEQMRIILIQPELSVKPQVKKPKNQHANKIDTKKSVKKPPLDIIVSTNSGEIESHEIHSKISNLNLNQADDVSELSDDVEKPRDKSKR